MNAPVLEVDCAHTYESGFRLSTCFQTDRAVTAISGPSGSGKSSVIAMIAGLLRPESGRIVVAGRTVTDTTSRPSIDVPAHRRRMGVLFQNSQLFPHLSVGQNLRFAVDRARRATHSASQGPGIAEVMDRTQIEPLVDRMPVTLSGGQRQRASLARAMLAARDLLLLDEPMTGIEDDLTTTIATFIAEYTESTRTPCLVASHDRQLIDQIATAEIRLVAASDGSPAGV